MRYHVMRLDAAFGAEVDEGIDEFKGFVRQVWIRSASSPLDDDASGVLAADGIVQFRGENFYDIVQRMLKEVQEKYAEKEFDDTEEAERPEARGEAMSKARQETSEEVSEVRKKVRKKA